LALIGLAASFHTSAVVLGLFVVLNLQRGWLVKGALAAPVAVLLYGSVSSASLDYYRQLYVDENLVSDGALLHVLLIVFPAALYLLFEKRLRQAGLADANVHTASMLAIAALAFLPLSSTGVDRLTLYLSFVQMWTYPSLVHARVMEPLLLKAVTAVLILLIFFAFFFFGSHAFAYLPYQNVLFIDA
jgi:hypothetical protein